MVTKAGQEMQTNMDEFMPSYEKKFTVVRRIEVVLNGFFDFCRISSIILNKYLMTNCLPLVFEPTPKSKTPKSKSSNSSKMINYYYDL
jgi:hypothetical protein